MLCRQLFAIISPCLHFLYARYKVLCESGKAMYYFQTHVAACAGALAKDMPENCLSGVWRV